MTGAAGLARAIAAGEMTAVEVVRARLDRIAALNPRLNALTRVLAEDALAAAGRADALVAAGGPLPPLLGVPFTVKENIDLAGTETTFGLRGPHAPAALDAPDVAHLRAAGAIPVARGNLPDLAMRWHTESALHGATVNPWDAGLSPGGSSGGDAVAVASGMTPLALGTDYGGSLRVPAALAGVCTLRPTPGRLPQAFAMPPGMSRQLAATDGPLARRVEDLGVALEAMARPDPRDPRFTPAPLEAGEPQRVALVVAPAGELVETEVGNALVRAADALEDAGYWVEELEAPLVGEAAQAWLDLLAFEARAGALPALRERGSDGTRAAAESLVRLGAPLDGEGYAAALAARHAMGAAWGEFLARSPLVLGPVSAVAPWPVGHDLGGDDAVREQWWGFRLTVATALLGLPAVAVPVGRDARGRPAAAQIAGARWHETPLLRAAAVIEDRYLPSSPP